MSPSTSMLQHAAATEHSPTTSTGLPLTRNAANSKPLGLSRGTTLTIGTGNRKTNRTTAIPVELFHEILSYFDTVPMEVMPPERDSGFYLRDCDALGRQDALRSLSQISRSWRAFFLPLAWESVELAGVRPGGGQWFHQTSSNLIEVGSRLATAPHLAVLVKHIRIVMTQSSIDKAMSAFVKALQACVNLKTIVVFFAHVHTGKHFKKAFAGLRFPSVKTLILPKQAHHILKTCPNVKKLYGARRDGNDLVNCLFGIGDQLELLAGITPFTDTLKGLSQVAPNIQELRLNGYIPMGEELGEFKHLRRIECKEYGTEENVAEIIQQRLARWKEVLSDCTIKIRPINHYWLHLSPWKRAVYTLYVPPRAPQA